jgi:bifunctional DNA-binding transcriptional regulator/antitoxin component of YhaV-PrlF toxin-antitoxin module
MQQVHFVKSFSQGQITIPKTVRSALDLSSEFWLKLQLVEGKILAEPVDKPVSKKAYKQSLLHIDTKWYKESDQKIVRESVKKRLSALYS